ncbi:MAG: hypothetical protein V7K40_08695 [Nostoc sp.]
MIVEPVAGGKSEAKGTWRCAPFLALVDELKSLLDKLLNQTELVIKWHS